MKRYLATFFRGKLLFLPALLLMTVASVAGAWLLAAPSYDATAQLWVDRSALAKALDPAGPTTFPAPPEPAEQQTAVFNQLLQSDAFVVGIVDGAPAARQIAPDEPTLRTLIEEIRSGLSVESLGPNSMRVAYTSDDPALAEQLIQSAIGQFIAWNTEQQRQQRESARQYYQRQLAIHEAQLNQLNQRVAEVQRNYLALNPVANPNAAAPQLVELERLQRELEAAQARYVDVKNRLDLLDNPALTDGTDQATQIRILDRPISQPQPPLARALNALLYALLGIAAGVSAVLAAVTFMTWRDDTIRTLDDLEALSDAPIIEALPHFKGDWRGANYSAARTTPARALDQPLVHHAGEAS